MWDEVVEGRGVRDELRNNGAIYGNSSRWRQRIFGGEISKPNV